MNCNEEIMYMLEIPVDVRMYVWDELKKEHKEFFALEYLRSLKREEQDELFSRFGFERKPKKNERYWV